MTEQRILKQEKAIKRAFISIVIIFFLTLIGFGYVVSQTRDLGHKAANLGVENRHRINDIQLSRLESCKTTYSGIGKVFKPFVPKHPTVQQQKNLNKFNKTILSLQKQCRTQILPKGKKKSAPTSTND